MKKVGYLHIFCRNGRTLIVQSNELSSLLKNKKDSVMVLPFLFDTKDVQIEEADKDELKDLLPNTIITSPFKIYFESDGSEENLRLNSKPISTNKIINGAKKLLTLVFGNSIMF